MKKLYVSEYHEHNCGMTGCSVVSERPASPAEILSAARPLADMEAAYAERDHQIGPELDDVAVQLIVRAALGGADE